MAQANFGGLRVLSLESRRAKEVEKLIRTYGGEPFVVPSVRELPLDSNTEALAFCDRLMKGGVDLVVFTTGVGVRALVDIAETRYGREEFLDALRRAQVAARSVKPASVLRELQVPIAVTAPEPNTWKEMLEALVDKFGTTLATMRVAVQEYGVSNPDLLAELSARCREVIAVPVYQWALPENTQPLRECILGLTSGGIDVILFMSAVQAVHLFEIATEMGLEHELRESLKSLVVVSVGPSTSEALASVGVQPDFEPSRPKMGFLMNEAAQQAGKLLEAKRRPATSTDVLSERTAEISPATSPAAPSAVDIADGNSQIDFLHEISSRMAAADSLHLVLDRIVDFIASVIPCDSCFIYILEEERLVLRASKNPHADVVDQLDVEVGQGVTGWVAKHRKPVALASNASNDPRFKAFKNLPEDHFEAMLCSPVLTAGRVIGVINLQHRLSYRHTTHQVRLLSTIGFLVGAEIERARLEQENTQLSGRLETRKAVDRAKSILQRDLGIGEEEAYQTMQKESRQRRKSMRDIADAIILSDDLRRAQSMK